MANDLCPQLSDWIVESRRYRRKEKALEDRVAHESGLGLNEFYLLYFLEREPQRKMRLQEAQDLVQMSQSAMSRLIQRLEGWRPALVERSTCDQDKRGVYVHLTEAGNATYDRVCAAIHDVLLDDG